MRIIAGKLRHRIIEMTNLDTTRETQDKVRGAIFNMIGPYLSYDLALDLFSGSGAMGIEAYSRGVGKVYFNDINKKALDVTKKNAINLGVNAEFYNLDYKEFIKTIDKKFDLIFLDPPYINDNIEEILRLTKSILSSCGIIVFEMSKESIYPDSIDDLKLKKNKIYGIKRVLVYEY